MRLIEKLILLFISIALAPILLLGSLLYVGTRNTITQQVMNQLESLATSKEHSLAAIHDQNAERLNGFAGRMPLRTVIDRYEKSGSSVDQQSAIISLQSTQNATPDFKKLTVLSPSGKVIASTDPSLLNSSMANDTTYQKGLKAAQLDYLVKDPDGKLSFHLSGPIYMNNRLIGVALAETSAAGLVDIAQDYTGLGQTGETIIAQQLPDQPAVFIAPLRFSPHAALIDPVGDNQPMMQALQQQERTFTNTVDYRGQSILAATRYVDNSGWGVIVKIDQAEATRPANRLLDILLIEGFVVSVGVVFVAIALARRLTEPMLDIDEVAEDVSLGHLTKRVAITTNDELSNLAGTFNTMLDNLEKLDKVKSEFVSLASHQLRTPASGVKARMSLLLNGYAGKMSKEQLNHLQQAYDTNERQLRVINDLLNVAIIESGHMKLDKKSTDVTALLQGIVDEVKAAVASRHQTLEVEVPKKPVLAVVDPDKIRMVLDNLLSNASKYTNDGGNLTVNLEVKPGHELTLTFGDNGVGIHPGDLPKLFQKFSQVNNHLENNKTRSGSAGLGLYLAKHIVELHGGSIEVDSEPGKGSTFTVRLPVQ